MSWADKKKYIFDIKQMGIDFITGACIGLASDKVKTKGIKFNGRELNGVYFVQNVEID